MKRLFLLDDGKDFEAVLRIGLHKRGHYPEIFFSQNKTEYQRHLPEGYDIYVLHLSYTSEEAIKELNEMQPWSKIVVKTSIKRDNFFIPEDLKSIISGSYDSGNLKGGNDIVSDLLKE